MSAEANGYHQYLEQVDAKAQTMLLERPELQEAVSYVSSEIKAAIELAFTDGRWKEQQRAVGAIEKMDHKVAVYKRESKSKREYADTAKGTQVPWRQVG